MGLYMIPSVVSVIVCGCCPCVGIVCCREQLSSLPTMEIVLTFQQEPILRTRLCREIFAYLTTDQPTLILHLFTRIMCLVGLLTNLHVLTIHRLLTILHSL